MKNALASSRAFQAGISFLYQNHMPGAWRRYFGSRRTPAADVRPSAARSSGRRAAAAFIATQH
jgi:hypothetical protein